MYWSVRSVAGMILRRDDAPDLRSLAADLEAAVSTKNLTAISSANRELALMGALSQSVGAVMYWQEPDDEDRTLSDPEIYELLEPVAQSVSDSPAARWWSTGVDLKDQQYTEWVDGLRSGPPSLLGARAQLESWRLATDADEEQAKMRPEDPFAGNSGYWWSVPIPSRLVCTTRGLPGLGAVKLVLAEDSYGWTEARRWPLVPSSPARILDIRTP